MLSTVLPQSSADPCVGRSTKVVLIYSASASAWACRCDEEAVEDDVRKRSASEDAMGAKTLCIPLEQPDLPPGTLCFASGRPAKNWALWGRSY